MFSGFGVHLVGLRWGEAAAALGDSCWGWGEQAALLLASVQSPRCPISLLGRDLGTQYDC